MQASSGKDSTQKWLKAQGRKLDCSVPVLAGTDEVESMGARRRHVFGKETWR